MKKVLLALLLFVTALGVFSTRSFANETGNIVIHFQAWDGNYEYLGNWAWGAEVIAPKNQPDGTDEFGVFFRYDNVPAGTAEIGFIAVVYQEDLSGPNWDNKLTGDMKIANPIVAGETVHVYVFEGAETKADDPQYFIADPTRFNALVVYYDPSGNYEETLGVHNWGWTENAAGWNDPLLVFKNAGKAPSDTPVKAAMFHAVEEWAGFLVYYGDGDGSKKTGDIKPDTGFFTDHVVGMTEVLYIVNAGDGVANNSNVFTDSADFVLEAFSFRLMPFDAEAKEGTFAVNPTTIFAKTSSPVPSPYAEAEEADKAAARAVIEGWFMVHEVLGVDTYGPALAIERIDFATTNTTLNTFVIILADGSELDNTKEYVIMFNDGTNEAELALNLDLSAPVITFITSSIAGKPANERIIVVPWGLPFNQNLFPRFRVQDDRDGDLTSFVFVPSDTEHKILDTRTEGDYTILLRVEDAWGNVTEETFIFRVQRSN